MKLITIFFCLFSFLSFAADSFDEETFRTQFFRLRPEGNNTHFQLAYKIYRNPNTGLSVGLLAGQHFALKEFYDRHTMIMKEATCVLYEGKGLDQEGLDFFNLEVIKNLKRSHLYSTIARAHNLQEQTDAIDYRQRNFVHADIPFKIDIPDPGLVLSEAQSMVDCLNRNYAAESEEKGLASGYEYYLYTLEEKEKQGSLVDKMAETSQALKDQESIEDTLKKNCLYQHEYVFRNDIVLEKFREQIADVSLGNPKHIVVYYGAGHMYFFEAQLTESYGLELKSEEWITAITMPKSQ